MNIEILLLIMLWVQWMYLNYKICTAADQINKITIMMEKALDARWDNEKENCNG